MEVGQWDQAALTKPPSLPDAQHCRAGAPTTSNVPPSDSSFQRCFFTYGQLILVMHKSQLQVSNPCETNVYRAQTAVSLNQFRPRRSGRRGAPNIGTKMRSSALQNPILSRTGFSQGVITQ